MMLKNEDHIDSNIQRNALYQSFHNVISNGNELNHNMREIAFKVDENKKSVAEREWSKTLVRNNQNSINSVVLQSQAEKKNTNLAKQTNTMKQTSDSSKLYMFVFSEISDIKRKFIAEK